MSDVKDHVDILSEDFENQDLCADSGHRRGSESSEASQASNLAGTRRHVDRGRVTQNEGPIRKKQIYPKVRSGCATCKLRKIKCDEGKPVCRNCSRSKLHHCTGYFPPQANIFEPSSAQLGSLGSSNDHLFVFFKAETARRLASYQALQLSLDFWQTLVPKLAEECAPIHHVMLALAAMQEEDEGETQFQASSEEGRKQAWRQQYGAALTKFRSGMESRSIPDDALMVCCLLLVLCHLWDFELLACFQHVFAGLRHYQHIKGITSSGSPLSNSINLRCEMMLPAFQHFAGCASVLLDTIDRQQLTLVSEFTLTSNTLIPSSFANVDEAYMTLDRVIREVTRFDPNSTGTILSEVRSYLAGLRSMLQQSLAIAYARTDSVLISNLRMLLVHERAASIMLSGLDAGNETIYDQHLIDFDFIASEMEDLMLAEDNIERPKICTNGVWMGMLPPLFLTSTKCRDSLLRHRAIDLMHVAPHEEYMWTSCIARQIATEIVNLEESNAFLLDVSAFTDDQLRLGLQSIEFDTLNDKIVLEFEIQTMLGPDIQRSTIDWQPKTKFESAEPFFMPRKMVQVCGYSTLMISFRPTGCHCETKVASTNDADRAGRSG